MYCKKCGEFVIDERELRRCLSLKLPQYMIPNYFMHLDYMPMTTSGKLDWKNLPIPDFTVGTREYEAPVTEMEKQLCHLLEELLHRKPVGAEDHFFELGGDSLTAIEYVAKAHVLGINLNLQNVFDFPTVRLLCKTLGNGNKTGSSYERIENLNVIIVCWRTILLTIRFFLLRDLLAIYY